MEILDPDLWNDDGTPKRPSKAYMDGLAVIQANYEGMARLVDETKPVERSDKPVVSTGESYLNYARIKREARSQRSPEVGDIVHFWGGKADEPELDHCFAAIVMEVASFNHEATIRVHVPHEAFMDWHVDHDEDKGHDTWHWPCGEGQ